MFNICFYHIKLSQKSHFVLRISKLPIILQNWFYIKISAWISVFRRKNSLLIRPIIYKLQQFPRHWRILKHPVVRPKLNFQSPNEKIRICRNVELFVQAWTKLNTFLRFNKITTIQLLWMTKIGYFWRQACPSTRIGLKHPRLSKSVPLN